MEDVIALEGVAGSGELVYFMTWGRIQDAVDPSKVEELVLRHSGRFKLPSPLLRVRVCDSLGDAAGAPGFFEAFFYHCSVGIPFGRTYQKWRRMMESRMEDGYEIAYLGVIK